MRNLWSGAGLVVFLTVAACAGDTTPPPAPRSSGIDRATFDKPLELPIGVKAVFVNGEQVWGDDLPTGLKPGRVLTHCA